MSETLTTLDTILAGRILEAINDTTIGHPTVVSNIIREFLDEKVYKYYRHTCTSLNLIEYLEAHKKSGMPDFSVEEMEELEYAFKNGDWSTVIRYINKYTEAK